MKFDRTVFQTLSLISQFGINMLVPIFLCSFAGIFLDRKLGTNFCMIILFFVGAVAGGYNVYRLAKKHMKKNNPNDSYIHKGSLNNEDKE